MPRPPCAVPERDASGRFITAERVGGGFMLLKRAVFERMMEAYPQTRYEYDFVGRENNKTAECYALFDPMVIGSWYYPEDYGFCHRWRGLGGKIWLDTQGKITHTGMHSFYGQGLKS